MKQFIIIPLIFLTGCNNQNYYLNKPVNVISESCSQYTEICYSTIEFKSGEKMQVNSDRIERRLW